MCEDLSFRFAVEEAVGDVGFGSAVAVVVAVAGFSIAAAAAAAAGLLSLAGSNLRSSTLGSRRTAICPRSGRTHTSQTLLQQV